MYRCSSAHQQFSWSRDHSASHICKSRRCFHSLAHRGTHSRPANTRRRLKQKGAGNKCERWPMKFNLRCRHCMFCTVAGSAVSWDSESLWTGTIVGAHGIVANVRTGIPDLTFVLICSREKNIHISKWYASVVLTKTPKYIIIYLNSKAQLTLKWNREDTGYCDPLESHENPFNLIPFGSYWNKINVS